MSIDKPMATKDKIKSYIAKVKDKKFFIYSDLNTCGNYASVRDAVVDLCRENILTRVAQGIYAKPETEFTLNELALAICKKNGCQGEICFDTIKNGRHIIKIKTTGSTRDIVMNDGTVLKFVHREEL